MASRLQFPQFTVRHVLLRTSWIYLIIISAILWGHEWSRKSILIHSDNAAVVENINKWQITFSSYHAIHAQADYDIHSTTIPPLSSSHIWTPSSQSRLIVSSLFSEMHTLGPRIWHSSFFCPTIFDNHHTFNILDWLELFQSLTLFHQPMCCPFATSYLMLIAS